MMLNFAKYPDRVGLKWVTQRSYISRSAPGNLTNILVAGPSVYQNSGDPGSLLKTSWTSAQVNPVER